MSLFKPFGNNRKLFQRNATSHNKPQSEPENEPSPVPHTPLAEQVLSASTPPAQVRSSEPASNFALEAEKQRQASIQSEWTQAIDTLGIASRMMTATTNAHKDALTANAPLIADIVRNIVERTLHGAMRVDDDALVRIIHSAAEALPADVVRLRMNPRDIERVRHLLPERLATAIKPDTSVESGCIAETQRASVDASHAAAREAVDNMLNDWLTSDSQ